MAQTAETISAASTPTRRQNQAMNSAPLTSRCKFIPSYTLSKVGFFQEFAAGIVMGKVWDRQTANPMEYRLMKVLLFQLDGKLPNVALMRLSHHCRSQGDSVEFRWTGSPQRELWDSPDKVFASAIFEKTRPAVERLKAEFPGVSVGGTGVDVASSLESLGIETKDQDYSIYPNFRQSIGFTQRGCRLRCPFCVVPRKEGAMREEQTVWNLWRGDPWPHELLLLDNDFFGQSHWRERCEEMRTGKFKVSFTQGINARFLTDEAAESLASLDFRDDSMSRKRIYTAWDNRGDEERLFAGLQRLVRYGIKPDWIMVYILVGYWPGETTEDRLYRWRKLRDFGARPYPMPFVRTKELLGFQRWIIGAYDKRITWADWQAADYRPENLG